MAGMAGKPIARDCAGSPALGMQDFAQTDDATRALVVVEARLIAIDRIPRGVEAGFAHILLHAHFAAESSNAFVLCVTMRNRVSRSVNRALFNNKYLGRFTIIVTMTSGLCMRSETVC